MSAPSPVMAIDGWVDNAALIADLPRLGYLDEDRPTLDPTYGYGRFWADWQPRPECFYASDLDPRKSPTGIPVDFRRVPFRDRSLGAVVLDPPYKLNGTSTGQGPAISDEAYGVHGRYVPWQRRHQLIRDGITEAHRVLHRKGFLLLKCQDQVCGGEVRWQTREFTRHAESLGLRLVDMLHLLGHRAQPAGRRQVHAARNYSTLLVLQRWAR